MPMNIFRIIDKALRKIPEWQLMDPFYRLNDDEVQNLIYNDWLEKEVWSRWNSVAFGYEKSVDREQFGYSPSYPIRVNGAVGEITYLSRLVTEDERNFLLFHRLGSIPANNHPLDVYEAVSSDGKFWTFLYLDFYYPKKSDLAPAGLKSLRKGFGISGTNMFLENFPLGIREELLQSTSPGYGLPVHPGIRALDDAIFTPPKAHREEKERLLGKRGGYTVSSEK